MGKGQRHLKHLKAEKAKVKLKAKKVKNLPKGLNIADASFKIKKIVIREQLKQYDENVIVSKRKLNIKDLLARLLHNNMTVRQEAVKQLKEILSEHSLEAISSQFSSLLQNIVALTLDKEKDVRRDSLKVISLILESTSTEQIMPFCDLLTSYLICGMTHIEPRIKEDSLLFLDVLVQHCDSILPKISHKILPHFLDMISKLHTETKSGRQLITIMNSKNTSVKWRIKVLERLSTVLNSVMENELYMVEKCINTKSKIIDTKDTNNHISIIKHIKSDVPAISFANNELDNSIDITFDLDKFTKYVSTLMQLMFDIWIEICPDNNIRHCKNLTISTEGAILLQYIVDIIQCILELSNMLNKKNPNIGLWIKKNFFHTYEKRLFSRFPYSTQRISNTIRQQRNSLSKDINENCLAQNLALCQIYTWFTVINYNEHDLNEAVRQKCNSILEYVNDKIEKWYFSDNIVLPYLTKLLQTVFFQASEYWYKSNINLGGTLKVIIHKCNHQPWKDLQSALFRIISEVTLDHSLHTLHSELVFKEFVLMLPNLLLKPSIHESTIELMKRVVLRYREWILEKLAYEQDAIISNVKNIEIIGTQNDKCSRLGICNLFYFLDRQIYY